MAYHHPIQSPSSAFHFLNSPFGDTTFTKVFVGGLAWETRSETLRRHFEQYGDILEAVVISDRSTGRSKGYGFLLQLQFLLLLITLFLHNRHSLLVMVPSKQWLEESSMLKNMLRHPKIGAGRRTTLLLECMLILYLASYHLCILEVISSHGHQRYQSLNAESHSC